MLRRTVCALGLAGSLPSPSSCFNLLLSSNVLRMTRYPPGKRSVNEYIKEHAPHFTPLRDDHWLIVWKTFTPEQKKSLMPGDVIVKNQPAKPQHEAFDLMIQGLHQAADTATECGYKTLSAAWIRSLADYRKTSPESLQRMDAEVVGPHRQAPQRCR